MECFFIDREGGSRVSHAALCDQREIDKQYSPAHRILPLLAAATTATGLTTASTGRPVLFPTCVAVSIQYARYSARYSLMRTLRAWTSAVERVLLCFAASKAGGMRGSMGSPEAANWAWAYERSA